MAKGRWLIKKQQQFQIIYTEIFGDSRSDRQKRKKENAEEKEKGEGILKSKKGLTG